MDDDEICRRWTDRSARTDLTQDQGVLKKTMWLEVMKEFKCQGYLFWSSCGDWRESFYSQGVGKNGRKSQLGSILGPRMGACT